MGFKNMLVRLNPALSKKWLLVLAGAMWSGVGILLLHYAFTWLIQPVSAINLLLGVLGVLISILANRFQFSKLAGKNITRILALNHKACIFAFQAWKGYLIIVIMVTGGILLRNSSIPKPYLAVVYAAIGGALLQASLQYYQHFFQTIRPVRSQLEY